MAKMNDEQLPGTVTDECGRLGEPRLVCRTSRKTLVGGYLMAALPCAFGAAILVFVVNLRGADWAKDIPGTIVMLTVAGVAFNGSWLLLRKSNRLRRVRVVAHDGGLTHQDWAGCVTCHWEQVEDVRWMAADHYEESSLYLYGIAEIPGTTTREFSHTTHTVTVRRNDGVQLVFTDELENVAGLARVIMECVNTTRRRLLGPGEPQARL